MKKLNVLDTTSLFLAIVGALNWGLVGLSRFDLVSAIFGEGTVLTRVIYVLVGLSGVYLVTVAMKLVKK